MNDKLNLIETIAKEDKFSTFSRLLGTSGANIVFSGAGQFTVFAPTNDAFGKIPDGKMNELLNEPNQTKLKALLSYHILPGKWMAANLGAMPLRKSVTGQEVAFTDSNGLRVNGAGVQARNIEATNGVIHQIDTVLAQPPNAAVNAARASAASVAPSTTPADLPTTTQAAIPTAIPAAVPAAVPTASGTPAKQHLL
ncbi:MAG TPA: fasciclin domain-containing protein [Pyrinomonadaceae bacterium]|nr:fasciclin domain-containing protein [Pyrinomonadaceae bacterium]